VVAAWKPNELVVGKLYPHVWKEQYAVIEAAFNQEKYVRTLLNEID
jgi:hypothetical protein